MKNEQPTLLILIPGFPMNENDSTCLPAQQQFIRSLNHHYAQLKVIILTFQYPYVSGEYSWHQNSVIAFGGKNRGGLARRWLWLKVFRTINKLKDENHVIGLLSFWHGESAFIANKAGRKNGIPHFSWIMGQDAKPGNKFVKKIHPDAAKLIAIADFTSDEFYRNYRIRPAHTIPIGIDSSQYSSFTAIKDIDILCAGSLIHLKQYHLAVDLGRAVKKKFPTFKMLICGKGPEEGKIRSLIDQYHLQSNIELLGEQCHSSILTLMRRSVIFLHPSAYEGFSGACLEAIGSGATVISFQQPMKDPIDHWYVTASLKDMINRALSLLKNPPDPTPVFPFDIARSTQQILALFQS